MIFTMKYTANPTRRTAFQKAAESLGVSHVLIPRGKPWLNGFIERSNRTDNEWLFQRERFKSSEERCYRLRLWEMYYNEERPHQGLGMRTPMEVYRQKYQLHATTRMLM